MKKILLSLLILFFMCACKRNDNELIMVTEAGFAPYEYYENGEIVGVDIDIAKEIAKELNKKLVIKDIDFHSIINEVKTGKADLGAAGISYTDERAKEVAFSINYATSKQVVIVKENSNFERRQQRGLRGSRGKTFHRRIPRTTSSRRQTQVSRSRKRKE